MRVGWLGDKVMQAQLVQLAKFNLAAISRLYFSSLILHSLLAFFLLGLLRYICLDLPLSRHHRALIRLFHRTVPSFKPRSPCRFPLDLFFSLYCSGNSTTSAS